MIATNSFLITVLHLWGQSGQTANSQAPATIEPVKSSVTVTEVAPAALPQSMGVLGTLTPLESPFSTAVFSEALIETLQARGLADILRRDPSIVVTSAAGTFNASQIIRGFDANSGSLRYDGLGPGLLFSGTNFPVTDFERVDVVKGPNSTLYGLGGFSQPGGVINLVPKRPPESGRPLFLEGSYAGRSLFSIRGDAGSRFGRESRFGYRTHASLDRGTLNAQRAEREFYSLNGAFDWRITDRARLAIAGHAVKTHIQGYLNALVLAAGEAVPAPPDPARQISQPWNFFDQDYQFADARFEYELSKNWTGSISSVGGRSPRPFVSPGTGTNLRANGDFQFNHSRVFSTYHFWGLQTNLQGTLNTGPLRHTITLSFNDEWTGFDSANFPLGTSPSNIYERVLIPARDAAPATPLPSFNSRAPSFSITDNIQITRQWSVLVGGRFNNLRINNFAFPSGLQTRRYNESRAVPTLATVFRPTPTLSLYGSYGKGLEPGGSAPIGSANFGEQLAPILSEQYEAGLKWDLRRGTLLNVAAFRIDKALEFLDPASNFFVQNGRQRHDGVELTLSGSVTSRLTLNGGYMYLKPVLRRLATPAFNGNDAIGVPRGNFSILGDYRVPGVTGLSLNAALEVRGPQFVNVANTAKIESWTRTDLGVSWVIPRRDLPLRFTARVDNIANHWFWASASGGSLRLGGPRTVSIACSWRF
jgi:iron complex outermembrane receptor protein